MVRLSPAGVFSEDIYELTVRVQQACPHLIDFVRIEMRTHRIQAQRLERLLPILTEARLDAEIERMRVGFHEAQNRLGQGADPA